MIAPQAEAAFTFAANIVYMVNTSYDLYHTPDTGSFSCEDRDISVEDGVKSGCLDKDDFFILLDPDNTNNNPAFINMYRY